MVDIPAVIQQIVQAAIVGPSKPVTTQVAALVAVAPVPTQNARAVQASGLAALVGAEGKPSVIQTQVLVAYSTGGEENLLNRSWSFVIDGHTFYAVTLGEQGTYVYDQTTGQWSRFQTEGLSSWNMEIGIVWNDKIIAADQSNPTIWELDLTSFLDDGFKPITRKVSSGYPVRGRDQPSNFVFSLVASVGEPEVPVTAPPTIPTVQLRYSDNQGRTFQDAGTLTLPEGNFVQVLQWLSLGSMQSPGRIFEVTDAGGLARIDSADAEIEGQP